MSAAPGPIIHRASVQEHFCKKQVAKDTGWKSGGIAPRHTPFAITYPMPAGWVWRALRLTSTTGKDYGLLFQVNPELHKWKAMLFHWVANGHASAVMRFEDQPGKRGGGLHIHAHCDQGHGLAGAKSVEMCYTLPEHGQRRRRRGAWTRANFVNAAGRFFRVNNDIDQGELL